MIRKEMFCGLALFLCASLASAGTISWNYLGDLSNGVFQAGWSVRLYEDVGSDNNFGLDGYVFGVNDTYVGAADSETFLALSKGKQPLVYGDSFIIPGGTLAFGDSVYTVIFNDAVAGNATQYIIIDANPFTLPADSSDAAYGLSSIAGTWQAVPEPGTLALLCVGLGTAAAASRRRKRGENKA